MTEIKSKEVQVNASQSDVYHYLLDLNNFKELLPLDKISDWQSDKNQCSFKIQKAATIQLIKIGSNEFDLIQLKSGDKSPFPFTLDIHIKDNGDGTCSGYQLFMGEMNMFIKMMAEKPLTALFNHIADRLVEVNE